MGKCIVRAIPECYPLGWIYNSFAWPEVLHSICICGDRKFLFSAHQQIVNTRHNLTILMLKISTEM